MLTYLSVRKPLSCPAPGSEPTIKMEIPNTTQDEGEQPAKRGRFNEQDLQLIHMGVDAIISHPPPGHGITQACPDVAGICYTKDKKD